MYGTRVDSSSSSVEVLKGFWPRLARLAAPTLRRACHGARQVTPMPTSL